MQQATVDKADRLALLTLIAQALAAATMSMPVILDAYRALKRISGLSDDELITEITQEGDGLDAEITKRLVEIAKQTGEETAVDRQVE